MTARLLQFLYELSVWIRLLLLEYLSACPYVRVHNRMAFSTQLLLTKNLPARCMNSRLLRNTDLRVSYVTRTPISAEHHHGSVAAVTFGKLSHPHFFWCYSFCCCFCFFFFICCYAGFTSYFRCVHWRARSAHWYCSYQMRVRAQYNIKRIKESRYLNWKGSPISFSHLTKELLLP